MSLNQGRDRVIYLTSITYEQKKDSKPKIFGFISKVAQDSKFRMCSSWGCRFKKKRLCSSLETWLGLFSGPARLVQLKFKWLKMVIQNGNIDKLSNNNIKIFIKCPYVLFFPKGKFDFSLACISLRFYLWLSMKSVPSHVLVCSSDKRRLMLVLVKFMLVWWLSLETSNNQDRQNGKIIS